MTPSADLHELKSRIQKDGLALLAEIGPRSGSIAEIAWIYGDSIVLGRTFDFSLDQSCSSVLISSPNHPLSRNPCVPVLYTWEIEHWTSGSPSLFSLIVSDLRFASRHFECHFWTLLLRFSPADPLHIRAHFASALL